MDQTCLQYNSQVRQDEMTTKYPIHINPQGETLSHKLFTTVLKYTFKNLNNRGVNIDRDYLSYLHFIDDIVLMFKNLVELQRMLEDL